MLFIDFPLQAAAGAGPSPANPDSTDQQQQDNARKLKARECLAHVTGCIAAESLLIKCVREVRRRWPSPPEEMALSAAPGLLALLYTNPYRAAVTRGLLCDW